MLVVFIMGFVGVVVFFDSLIVKVERGGVVCLGCLVRKGSFVLLIYCG